MTPQAGYATALDELWHALAAPRVWLHLGLADIVGRYRRTLIGPFWLTLSSAAMIATVGVLYASIFRAPLEQYIPYLAMGLLTWSYISNTISDGANVFIQSATLVRSTPMPLITHVMRMMWRNIIIMAHNVVVVVLVWIAFQWMPPTVTWLALPGLALTMLFLLGLSLTLSIVCTRFRDVPQILTTVLTLLFLLTPIMWQPEGVLGARYVLDFNPIFYFIEIVRDPLLGRTPELQEWLIASAATGVVLMAGLIVFSAFRKRIAYWL